MIGKNVREKIVARLGQLIQRSADFQFTTEEDLPKNNRSFTLGEYPAWLTMYWPIGEDGKFTIAKEIKDASGSSIMGLWFLSQSHNTLRKVTTISPSELCDKIKDQLERAAHLPRFFQGDEIDKLYDSPKGSMGWWPLFDGYRFPAILGDWFEQHIVLTTELRVALSNLADGDFWAWCMAIDQTTPELLEYNTPIESTHFYELLLGSQQSWDLLHPQAKDLVEKVWGPDIVHADDKRLPIGTYYGVRADIKSFQRISCVVNANILSSIPILDGYQAHKDDVDNAIAFLRLATCKAMDPNDPFTWADHSYDYFPIELGALGYVVRAHKRIIEIKKVTGHEDYPDLLDSETLQKIVDYLRLKTREYLNTPNVTNPNGANAYANLVYAFNSITNLRFTDNSLFTDDEDWALYQQLMEMMLIEVPSADYAIGTGPFPLPLGAKVEMASTCFVTPPLIESFVNFLFVEDEHTP